MQIAHAANIVGSAHPNLTGVAVVDRSIEPLLQKAIAGERLAPDEGLRLIESHDLAALGRAADAVTRRLHPESYRTYNIDRNVNYTNVCTAVCDFLRFYRTPRPPKAIFSIGTSCCKRSKRPSTWAATRF